MLKKVKANEAFTCSWYCWIDSKCSK